MFQYVIFDKVRVNMKDRIEGVQYLRTIMSIFVVIWHFHGCGTSEIFSKEDFPRHTFSWSDFCNFHILLLAVPSFVFMSIFFYALKPSNKSTFNKRLTRLVILITFWPVASILFKSGYNGIIESIPHSYTDAVITILTTANSGHYFFASLIINTMICHWYIKATVKWQFVMFLISLILLFLLPLISMRFQIPEICAYWSPLNFIPISFLAVLVANHRKHVQSCQRQYLIGALFLNLIFSILEWNYFIDPIFFTVDGYCIPAYTRVSLLFGVCALVILFLDPRLKSNYIIDFMSKFSLFLYCSQFFLIPLMQQFVNLFIEPQLANTYVAIFLVVSSSYLMGWILQKFYLKENVVC